MLVSRGGDAAASGSRRKQTHLGPGERAWSHLLRRGEPPRWTNQKNVVVNRGRRDPMSMVLSMLAFLLPCSSSQPDGSLISCFAAYLGWFRPTPQTPEPKPRRHRGMLRINLPTWSVHPKTCQLVAHHASRRLWVALLVLL